MRGYLDPSPASASAVTALRVSPGASARFIANRVMRVRLSAEKPGSEVIENGSCCWVTDSRAMARVEVSWLIRTGLGTACAWAISTGAGLAEMRAAITTSDAKRCMTEVVRVAIILAWIRISAFCTPKQVRGQSIVRSKTGELKPISLTPNFSQVVKGRSLGLEPFQRFMIETIEMVQVTL